MRREATNTPAPSPAAGLLRAALLGLCAGALLGGIGLIGLGIFAFVRPMDCGDFAEEECAFTRDTARDMGRVQGVSGSALLALGLATAAFVSRGKTPAAPPPAPSSPLDGDQAGKPLGQQGPEA